MSDLPKDGYEERPSPDFSSDVDDAFFGVPIPFEGWLPIMSRPDAIDRADA